MRRVEEGSELHRRATRSSERDRHAETSGRPLDAELRTAFEHGFAHHLDEVRIHDGGEAGARAEALGASAFTIGSDIYFAEGAFDPSTPDGAHRLAHELAHVVQLREHGPQPGESAVDGAAAGGPGTREAETRDPATTDYWESAEVEAREAATSVLSGGTPVIGAAPSVSIACEEEKRGFDAGLLPPSLSYGFGVGGGSANLSLSPGGLGAEYKRGMFHADAGLGFGGGTELNLGVGAPLQPWLMDVNRDLTGAAGGVNSLMNGRGVNLGALSGFGALGDVYGAGEPSKHSWGAGLQLSHSDEETRAMLGLRFNL